MHGTKTRTLPALSAKVRYGILVIMAACLVALAFSGEMSGQTVPSFTVSSIAPTGLGPYEVELADMDGDGDKDLVTSNIDDQETGTVTVSKNNGGGTFAAPAAYNVGPVPSDMRVADFNGDGKPDVVCIAAQSGNHVNDLNSFVTVLLNNGSGELGNRQDYCRPPRKRRSAVTRAEDRADEPPHCRPAFTRRCWLDGTTALALAWLKSTTAARRPKINKIFTPDNSGNSDRRQKYAFTLHTDWIHCRLEQKVLGA